LPTRSPFAAAVPERVLALMIATQRPIALAALNEPLTSAAWTSKPSWQIRPAYSGEGDHDSELMPITIPG
jgi:hypothetical protein